MNLFGKFEGVTIVTPLPPPWLTDPSVFSSWLFHSSAVELTTREAFLNQSTRPKAPCRVSSCVHSSPKTPVIMSFVESSIINGGSNQSKILADGHFKKNICLLLPGETIQFDEHFFKWVAQPPSRDSLQPRLVKVLVLGCGLSPLIYALADSFPHVWSLNIQTDFSGIQTDAGKSEQIHPIILGSTEVFFRLRLKWIFWGHF